MNYDTTLINYFLQASLIVKIVMLILTTASIFSWSYILQRFIYLQRMKTSAKKFERSFWSVEDPSNLYIKESQYQPVLKGLEAIFYAGYREFQRFRNRSINNEFMFENIKRAMRAQQMREQDCLESRLSFLAIVGSISPYIGLFGTVWGIMQALSALATAEQASIAMVAPGMAEALIATALGLFAAIPAVIAYNRFIADIGHLMVRFDVFQEEFINLLTRKTERENLTAVGE